MESSIWIMCSNCKRLTWNWNIAWNPMEWIGVFKNELDVIQIYHTAQYLNLVTTSKDRNRMIPTSQPQFQYPGWRMITIYTEFNYVSDELFSSFKYTAKNYHVRIVMIYNWLYIIPDIATESLVINIWSISQWKIGLVTWEIIIATIQFRHSCLILIWNFTGK